MRLASLAAAFAGLRRVKYSGQRTTSYHIAERAVLCTTANLTADWLWVQERRRQSVQGAAHVRSYPNCYHDDLRQQNDASYQYRKS